TDRVLSTVHGFHLVRSRALSARSKECKVNTALEGAREITQPHPKPIVLGDLLENSFTVLSNESQARADSLFVLAYGFSWLVFVLLVIFHGPLQWILLATFGPTFAALVTNRIVAGNYRAFR